jgi:hypothetical protein
MRIVWLRNYLNRKRKEKGEWWNENKHLFCVCFVCYNSNTAFWFEAKIDAFRAVSDFILQSKNSLEYSIPHAKNLFIIKIINLILQKKLN